MRTAAALLLLAAFAAVVCVLALGSGAALGKQHFDALLIALAGAGAVALFLIHPPWLNAVTSIEVGRLKVQLQHVQQAQNEHNEELDNLRLTLPLLLTDHERSHLENLLAKTATGYTGSNALREELRRLRSLRLITMTNQGHIADLRDGMQFDLSHYVALTDLARRFLARLHEVEPPR